MPSRIIPLVNGEYYHVFNRGVAQMQIFNTAFDYKRFIKAMLYYQAEGPKPRFSIFSSTTNTINTNKKIANIISYCLMPNHFHFLLEQVRDNGISEFISKLTNSYTKYFNIKNKRIGPLLQGQFKAVHIEDNEQLLHTVRYIHLNPLVGYLINQLEDYPWSSYNEYIGIGNRQICSSETILNQFNSSSSFKQFVLDQEDYGKKLEAIKHLLIDYPDV